MGRVRIANESDVLGTVDEAELQTAINSGFRVVDDAEAKDIRRRRAASSAGGVVRGTVEAAASGATLGLSDLVATAAGADPEAMAARRESAGTLGEIANLAGAAAPALLTGGTSAAGTAAGAGVRAGARLAATATPAGGAARLGLAAARGVGGSKARQMAVQGATEGFLQGVGAEVSEAALGDHELAAERLLAGGFRSAGLGALLGGGTSVLGSGLARVARGGERVSQAALGRVAGLTGDVSDPAVRAAFSQGGTILEKLQHAQMRALGASDNAHAGLSHLSGLARSKEGAALVELAKNRTGYAGEVGKRVGKVWSRADVGEAAKRYEQAFLADARDRGVKATEEWASKFRQMSARVRRTSNSRTDSAMLKEASKILEQVTKPGGNPYRWASKISDDLDAVRSKYEPAGATEGTRSLEFFSRSMRETVNDPLLWGRKAPGMRALSVARELEDEALGALPAKLRKTIEAGGMDDEAARTLAKYPDKAAALLDARSKVADALEQAGEDVAGIRDGIEEVRKALSFRDELEQAGEAWRSLQSFESSPQAKRLSNSISTAGTLVGGVAGGLVGALGGRFIGSAIQAGTRPAATLAAMARLRQAVDKVASRESSAIKGFETLASGGGAAARAARGASAGAVKAGTRLGKGAISRSLRDEPDRRAALEQVRRSVVQLASHPAEIPDRMELHDLRQVAPRVADAMAGRASAAIVFLAQRAPQAYTPAFSTESYVDQDAMERFGRYVDAVSDPLGAAEQVLDGGLALEHAEALRVVYPKIYARLRSDVLTMLGTKLQNKEPVDYQARVRLGLLLQLPLADELRPDRTPVAAPPPAPAPPLPKLRANAGADEKAVMATATGPQRLEAGGSAQ